MAQSVEIHVLDKKVRLLQPEKGFRTSLDSVMVAAACPVAAGQRVLDMGCGVGAVSFCILHRVPEARVVGVDIQDAYVELAQQNRPLNGTENVTFMQGDIRDFRDEERFDHVVCNPPFLEAGHHTRSPEEGLAVARGHDDFELNLADWIDAGFHNLKSGGSLTIIHRADATDRIVQALGRRFGAVEIIPLWPHVGEDAKRVVIRAVKDRKTPATLHYGLVLHEADGAYTEAADKVLRGGASLL
ncbi:MAG: methyltransferase [Chloroflexi bacterium]|nr:methyltransferase [Chloroflexota bacterium]